MGVPWELPILNSSTMQGERRRNLVQLRGEPTVCSPSSVIELAIRPAITPFNGDQFPASTRFDATSARLHVRTGAAQSIGSTRARRRRQARL